MRDGGVGIERNGVGIGGDRLIELPVGLKRVGEIDVGVEIVCPLRDGRPACAGGVVQLPAFFQNDAEVVLCFWEVGPERDALGIGGDRIVDLSAGLQGNAEVVLRFGGMPIEHGCLPARGDGLVELPLVFQGVAKVAVGLGKSGIERDGPMIGSNGLIEMSRRMEGIAEIGMGFGNVGIKGQCPADQVDRRVMPAHLMGHHAEKVQCADMLGLLGKNVPINLLGLLKLPGLVVLNGNLKRLLDGELSHWQAVSDTGIILTRRKTLHPFNGCSD